MIIDLSEMKSGFSDRLRLITYVIAISKLKYKKLKILKIIEKKNKECPYLFYELCKIKNYKLKKISRKKFNEITVKMNSYNSDVNLKNCNELNPFSEIDSSKLYEEWKKSYQLLLPKLKIKNKIKKIRLPNKYIGLHVRTTDKLVNLYTKLTEIPSKTTIIKLQLNFFINNLPKIIKSYSLSKNIFIACDDKTLKVKIIKILAKEDFSVFYNKSKFNKNRFRQTNGEDFVIDLFSLANSDLIISSTGGGVPASSSLISKNNITFIDYSNKKNFFYLINIISKVIYFTRKILNKIRMFNFVF